MKRGRPPKSDIEKLMSGDPGKRISAADKKLFNQGKHPAQVQGALTPVTAPAGLTKPALAIWKELIAAHPPHTYAASDRYQLTIYCEAVATFLHATKQIGTDYLGTGSTGQIVISQWVTIRDKAAQTIDKVGPSLWLTPQARQSIKAAPEGSAPATGPFKGLIQ